jgi:hypothetical protein
VPMNRGSLTACARRTSSTPTRFGSTHREEDDGTTTCGLSFAESRALAPLLPLTHSLAHSFRWSSTAARSESTATSLRVEHRTARRAQAPTPTTERTHCTVRTVHTRRRSIERSIETRATFRARIRRHSRLPNHSLSFRRLRAFSRRLFLPPEIEKKEFFSMLSSRY